MTPLNLINKRLDYLQEKEIMKGLTNEEQIEIGKLYIAIEIFDKYKKLEEQSELNTLKKKYEELKEEYELLIGYK